MILLWILLFSALGSVFSTIGGVLLLWKEDFAKRISLFFITFAAGVLLGVAFLDLFPEAVEGLESLRTTVLYMLGAIVVLFVVERFLWWYHHHRFEAEEHHAEHREQHTLNRGQIYLLLTGDALHNFVDGVVIAAAFFVDVPLGIAVAIGVIAHELPQEMADFGLMIAAGFTRAKTITFNLVTASFTIIGALLAYGALLQTQQIVPVLLAIGAGTFVYIALSDLIPSIHHQSEHKHDFVHFLLFVLGLALIFILGTGSAEHHGTGERIHEDDHTKEHIE